MVLFIESTGTILNIHTTHTTVISFLRYAGPMWLLYLIRPPRFDWYVVQWGSNRKHQKDTCFEEIRLHYQILIIALHSIMNTPERTYVYIKLRNQQTCTSDNHSPKTRGGRSNLRSIFCICFIVGMLVQHKFCHIHLISRNWRTWKKDPRTLLSKFLPIKVRRWRSVSDARCRTGTPPP